MDGAAAELAANEDVKEFYLGIASGVRRNFRDVNTTAEESGGLHEEREDENVAALLALAGGVPARSLKGIRTSRFVWSSASRRGAADIISRAMSDPLTRALGQGIIVDNKPGAGSSLAADSSPRPPPTATPS